MRQKCFNSLVLDARLFSFYGRIIKLLCVMVAHSVLCTLKNRQEMTIIMDCEWTVTLFTLSGFHCHENVDMGKKKVFTLMNARGWWNKQDCWYFAPNAGRYVYLKLFFFVVFVDLPWTNIWNNKRKAGRKEKSTSANVVLTSEAENGGAI